MPLLRSKSLSDSGGIEQAIDVDPEKIGNSYNLKNVPRALYSFFHARKNDYACRVMLAKKIVFLGRFSSSFGFSLYYCDELLRSNRFHEASNRF
jgi:hypothetical protein